MDLPAFYLFPLFSAVVYAVGATFVKQAITLGGGATRTFAISNWIMGIAFIPLLFLIEPDVQWARWWIPFVHGSIAFVGAAMNFAALRLGDVSVVTPVMGSKVIFVAIFTLILIRHAIPWEWWVGAVLTVISLWLLTYAPSGESRKVQLWTAFFALLSAAAFAITDVMTQRFARDFGFNAYLVVSMGALLLWTPILIPFFQGKVRDYPLKSWGWVTVGQILVAVNFVALYFAISTYGRATAMNIIYSSRGIWTIIFVWVAGSLIGNMESATLGRSGMTRRLAGGLLLCVAIALVLSAS